MADPNKILKLLRDELALQSRHVKLLEAQQQALLACDRPRFCNMQAEQELMISLLEAQASARETEMHDSHGNIIGITALMERLPDKQQRALGLVRDQLIRTVDQVQALSVQNKRLIQNELEYIAFSLDLFVEAGRKARTVYGGSSAYRGRMLLDRRA